MATLNTLRNKGGILVAVVIGIALLAFLLGDLLSSGSTLLNSSQMNVGTIDGEDISQMEYAQTIDKLTEVQRITTGVESSTEEQSEMIRSRAWELMIRNKALEPSLAEVGVSVSENELIELISGQNPSAIIARAPFFTDPQTGMYDPILLQQFVVGLDQDQTGRMPMLWNYLQSEVSAQSLIIKFKTIIDKAAYVTTFEAEKLASLESKNYSVDYLVSRYETIADSTVQVSDAELRKYYNSHKGMFKQDELREIEYVTFEALPSASDYTAAEESVQKLATELAAAQNVKHFVSMNSHNPYDGRYYNAGEITGEMGKFAFRATADQVYGPILNGDQWTLARVADVQVMPDSIQLSNIIISAAQKPLADSLITALKNGGNFAQAAMTYSEDMQSGANGGDIGMMDIQALAPQFTSVLKGAKRGDVKSVSTPEAIFILKVTATKGESQKVQLGVLNYNIEASEVTRNDVYGRANKFATEATSKGFESAANNDALAKRVAAVRSNDRTVGGIQQSRELARWAFNGEQDDMSEVFEFGTNFVVAKITGNNEKGIASFDQVKADVKRLVIREKKGKILAQTMAGVTSIEALGLTLETDRLSNNDINFQGFMAPEVGFDPAFTGGVSGIAKTGVLSKPIIGQIGVYAAQITAERDNTIDPAIAKARLSAEAQQSAFMATYESFLNLSEIQDTRYKFY